MSQQRLKGDVLALDPGTLPATGSQSNEVRNDSSSGDLKRWNAALSQWVPLGSGGGGGSSLQWNQKPGGGPIEDIDAQGDRVFLFEPGLGTGQKLRAAIKVPTSYIPGSQVSVRFTVYSPASSNNWQFTADTYLVPKNTGDVTLGDNLYTDDSGDFTNSSANKAREVVIPLSDSSGEINSIAIAGGDLLQIELYRGTPGGTDDTNDIRMYPGSAEILFS
jgi:hypothetical protein